MAPGVVANVRRSSQDLRGSDTQVQFEAKAQFSKKNACDEAQFPGSETLRSRA
jgi:hypothetical protein